MKKVKCVFCKTEDWSEKMYYCPHDEIWVCSSCVEKSGLWGTGKFKCPKCHKDFPGQ